MIMRIFRYMLIYYMPISCTFETFHCWLIYKMQKSIYSPILRNQAFLYFLQHYIICTVIRQALHGSLNHKMDRTFWLLMVAACVCGSYRNSSQLPEPYTENLARSVGNERNERAFSVPHYVHQYKEIISGTRVFGYNLKFL